MPESKPAVSRSAGESPRDLFLAHLALIERVIGYACRRHHLRQVEAEDFASAVKVKLIEDDYAVLRKFQGESRLETYLTTVVHRFFFDLLRARKGRPRASSEARRLGSVGIRLERLLYWDGFSFDEAHRILRENHGVELSWQELEEYAGRLPPRVVERRHEGGERIDHLGDEQPPPDEAVLERERREEAVRVAEALNEALRTLEAEDRLILKMLYESGLTVAQVARTLGLDQKTLYRRRDRLLSALRRELEARGLRDARGWWS